MNYQVPEHFWTSGKLSAYHEGICFVELLSFCNYHYKSFPTYDFHAFLEIESEVEISRVEYQFPTDLQVMKRDTSHCLEENTYQALSRLRISK